MMERARPWTMLVGGAILLVASGLPGAAKDAIRKVPAPSPASQTVPAADPPPIEISRRGGPGEKTELTVMVDRAKIIRLPERSQTVVIGNPAIADLAIQKNGVVVVTGKSYGTTNIIALDSTGAMLAESTVTVTAPTESVLVVQRGLERQSYTCKPGCQPSVVLGDSNTYFNETRGQVDQRNQFATSR